MWTTLPLERFVEHTLKQKHTEKGATLWSRYVELRTEVSEQILPWIQRNEPNLSDHGVNHILDVMGKVTELLGLPKEHGGETDWVLPDGYNVFEMLLLLLGCLTHDIGNILGREKHNLAIAKAADLAGKGWKQFPIGDRRIIEQIGRAHSGKSPQGSKDTLQTLAAQPAFFAQTQVRLVEVAAVLRFADELAEGPQRTSAALLALSISPETKPEHRLDEGSKLYHLYASITSYNVDYAARRILIDYDIDRESPAYGLPQDKRREQIEALLRLAYARALKLNAERQYARHYARALSHFRETSINLRFNNHGQPLEELDRTVIISDARTAFEGDLRLEKLNPKFDIDQVLNALLETEMGA
jgi:HD superfamily phosphodiesterase